MRTSERGIMPNNPAEDIDEHEESEPNHPPRRMMDNIFRQLASTLQKTLARLERAADGESVFASDADARVCIAVLEHMPHAIETLQEWENEWSDDDDDDEPRIPLIPKCPICKVGPGGHWPDDCPQN